MNDSIPALGQLIEPPPVPFTFGAPGWTIFGILVLVLLIAASVYCYIRYRKNKYRREAIAWLQQEEKRFESAKEYARIVYAADRLIKRIGMQKYGREQVASLKGMEWLDFLNKTSSSVVFDAEDGKTIALLYEDEKMIDQQRASAFINKTKHWIKSHKHVR